MGSSSSTIAQGNLHNNTSYYKCTRCIYSNPARHTRNIITMSSPSTTIQIKALHVSL